MAPVTKYNDDLPAVSLSLVKDASNDSNNTIDTNGTDGQISRAAMMSMIFQLMSQIGINQSIIAKANAQSQVDQTTIAEAQANNAQALSQTVSKQVDDYMKQLEESQKWSFWGSIFKWIVAAIVIVIGALTSEFGVGLLLLTAVTVFMASPLFDMAVGALAKGLEAAGLPSTWANVLAQIIVIVIVTICTLGIGTAGEAANLAAKGAGTAAEIGSTAAQAALKMALQAMLQALLSSSVLPQLLAQIPGIDKIPVLQAILTIVLTIIIAVVAGKLMSTAGATEGQSLLSKLGTKLEQSLVDIRSLETAVNNAGRVARVAGTAAEAGAGTGTAVYELKASDVLKILAPLQALMGFVSGIATLMSKMSDQIEANTQSSMKTFNTLFNTKFYADMEAAKAYLV